MQKFVILSVLFCFVVAGAVQIPTLSDQATFAKYLAAFADKKALLTTRQPGTTCLATPISCSIEGYIKGTQFQSLDIVRLLGQFRPNSLEASSHRGMIFLPTFLRRINL